MSSTVNNTLLLTVLNAVASRVGGPAILEKVLSDTSLIEPALAAEIDRYLGTETSSASEYPDLARALSSAAMGEKARAAATPATLAARARNMTAIKSPAAQAGVAHRNAVYANINAEQDMKFAEEQVDRRMAREAAPAGYRPLPMAGGAPITAYPLIVAFSRDMSRISALIAAVFRLAMSTPVATTTAGLSPSLVDGRVMEKGGKLVFVKNDGSEELLLLDSAEFGATRLQSQTCKSVGLNSSTPTGTCMNYLLNCLQGKDIQQCKTYMKNPSFYKDMAREVYNLDLDTLKHFLDALQFRMVKVNDPVTGRAIQAYESYSEWAARLKSVLGETDAQAILDNKELTIYIQAVKNRLDLHPKLTNPSMAGIRSSAPISKTQTAINYGLQSKGDVPRSVTSWERSFNVVNQHFAQARAYLGLAVPTLGLTALPIAGMIGGGSRFEEIVTRRPSKILRAVYNSVASSLSAKGTTLSAADKQRIEELFNVLSNTEETLIYAIRILDLYSGLMDVLPSNVASGAGLSLQQMENEVRSKAAARLDKTEKRSMVLTDCLRTICSEVGL